MERLRSKKLQDFLSLMIVMASVVYIREKYINEKEINFLNLALWTVVSAWIITGPIAAARKNDPLAFEKADRGSEVWMKRAFIIAVISTFAGFWLKIEDQAIGSSLLAIGCAFTVIWTLLAIYEVWTSCSIRSSEKCLWITAFIAVNPLAGLFYIFGGRIRVTNVRKDDPAKPASLS